MLDPEFIKKFEAELEATGLDTVKTNLDARIYGPVTVNEVAQLAQRWIWRKEREAIEAREARIEASSAAQITIARSAKNAAWAAAIAAIIAAIAASAALVINPPWASSSVPSQASSQSP